MHHNVVSFISFMFILWGFCFKPWLTFSYTL